MSSRHTPMPSIIIPALNEAHSIAATLDAEGTDSAATLKVFVTATGDLIGTLSRPLRKSLIGSETE
jgi:hypothetical protein